MEVKKILFLCAQPAGYLFDCINEINRDRYHITCVYLEEDILAPFDLKSYFNINFIKINAKISIESLLKLVNFKPDILITSGWAIKSYNQFCDKYKKSGCTIVLMMDTPWLGSLKQLAFSKVFKTFFLTRYAYAWVPGEAQKKYALKLGFKPDKIKTGLYTTNHTIFYRHKIRSKEPVSKKTLLFAGRLVEYKGVKTLVKALEKIPERAKANWTIKFIGNGPLDNYLENKGYQVFSFLQSVQLAEQINASDAFYLGSQNENWGVSVHDAVACGLPIILSNQVHSREVFLLDNENGFEFRANDSEDLKIKLEMLFSISDQKLIEMSNKSLELSLTFSIKIWLQTLESFNLNVRHPRTGRNQKR